MTNWGYGWECENSEYTRADVRIEKHREPITA